MPFLATEERCCINQKKCRMLFPPAANVVAWLKFSMSFPRRRESREHLNELYSKILYNFAYFKCFFWIPAYAGMTYGTFLELYKPVPPCHNDSGGHATTLRLKGVRQWHKSKLFKLIEYTNYDFKNQILSGFKMTENKNFANKHFEFIKNEINNNNVVLFMKGTKESPMCGFSATVVAILEKLNVEFRDINVLSDPELREALKIFSDWPTFPQLYIKGEFIGGSDIVKELYQNGELTTLLMKI